MLYGTDALSATQVDQWLDFLPAIAPGGGLPAACAYVDSYLSLRTVLVGFQLTIADLALWGSLMGTPQFAVVTKGGKCAHLLRWYNFCSAHPALKVRWPHCYHRTCLVVHDGSDVADASLHNLELTVAPTAIHAGGGRGVRSQEAHAPHRQQR